MTAWEDLPERTVHAWVAAAGAIERALLTPPKPMPVTVHFSGGPWHGKTTDVERVVGPVFGPGHEVGNHYWLDTKGTGQPTYHWDGAEWAERTP